MSVIIWLITGCSTGFGRVFATLLLARGEHIVATARNPRTLDTLVAPYGRRALAFKLDVTCLEDMECAVAEARGRFGTIVGGPVAAARAMMETHLFGALAIIKAVIPEMRQRRSGRIVNIGSVAGQDKLQMIKYCMH